VLAFELGLPIGLQVVLAIAGLSYLPMAILGVTILNSWDAIAPRVVGRGIGVDLRGYLRLALVFALAVSLPGIGIALMLGSTVALSAAIVGPLLLAPGLATARLLGRYFYAREQSMRRALGLYRSLGSRLQQESKESSRRASLRRHDRKRGHTSGVDSRRSGERIVEANAPIQRQRGSAVAGPRSPSCNTSRLLPRGDVRKPLPASRPRPVSRPRHRGNRPRPRGRRLSSVHRALCATRSWAITDIGP